MRATGKRRRWFWWKWGNGVALTEMTFSIKLTKPVSLLLSHSLPILLFEPCVRVLTHHRADTHFGQRAHGPRPNDALAGAPRTCGKVLMLMRSPGTRAAADMPACGARCVHWRSETRGAKAADGAAAAATSAAVKTGECIDLWQRMRTRSELGPTEERRQRIEWGLCSPARHHRQCTHRTRLGAWRTSGTRRRVSHKFSRDRHTICRSRDIQRCCSFLWSSAIDQR